MPGKQRSKIQCERDRATISELYLKGWSQTRIGDFLELNQATISREISKLKTIWKSESVRDYELHVTEELRRLAMIETEYWQGWQSSQTAKEQSLQEKLSELAGSNDSKLKVQKRTETRTGDPRFLEGLLKCIDQRAKLLDLYPKTDNKTEPTAAEQNLKGYLSYLEESKNSVDKH